LGHTFPISVAQAAQKVHSWLQIRAS